MDFAEVMSPDLEKLLDGSGWVRNLARSLVADPNSADDLVQEAWVVALEREPVGADARGLRRWMAAVLRNLARDRYRGAGRRRAHEGHLARDAAGAGVQQPDASETLERLETHRKLVEAIRSLNEPFRTAIMLRFLDGKSPAEIARQLGVPVRTVHSRLNRALSKLRARLRRDYEDGKGTWLLALLPLSREGSGWTAGTLSGALLMNVKLKLVVTALALTGVAAIATLTGDGVSPPPAVAAHPRTASADLPSDGFEEPIESEKSTSSVRELAIEEREAPAVSTAPTETRPSTATVEGRLLLVDGTPAADIRVGVREGLDVKSRVSTALGMGPTAISGKDGRFSLDTSLADQAGELQAGEVVVLDERYTTVVQPGVRFGQHETTEQTWILAARQPLAGTVVDTEGNPLPGATVTAEVRYELRTRFNALLEFSRIPTWAATTDANGVFEIPDAPHLANSKLVTVCPGFAKDFRPLPEAPTAHLEIVLGGTEEGLTHLMGTVVDAGGQPVAGAYVALEYTNGTTDAEGRFRLRLFGEGERGVLMALKRGSLPARVERAGDSNLDPRAWPDPLVLTLGGSPLSIGGRVVDPDGNPIEKAEVWTADTTHFGAIESDAGPMVTVAADVESLLAGNGHQARRIWTDEDGAFELHGLLDKNYRISVRDGKSVRFFQTEPVRAGTVGLRVEMPEEERIPRVAGRVVNSSGDPVPGVRVSICQLLEPRIGYSDSVRTRPVTSDEEGRFALRDVPASMTHFQLSGPGLDFMDNRRPIPEGADLENLELVAMRGCRARIELGDPEKANLFGLLDGDGKESMVTVFGGDSASSGPRGSLLEGRSQIFSASESASTLVLFKGTEEVQRIPLQLDPGELTVLEL